MKDYEVVVGLEVHSQLRTKSKMFCSCSAGYQDAPPNTIVCEVCMGMPGVLPVINKRAVELVIATGLALNCKISRHTKFDRKNYPYPDLMKGYQISQYDMPIATEGRLDVEVGGVRKTIGITRVHLEEDVSKLMHRSEPGSRSYSLLDVNRAGVPLMETVSEPDMRSAEEARAYLVMLRSILRYAGVSTANMEEGSFRCDANISIRPSGAAELGTKVEVKNMNSFRSVYSALVYEAERQTRLAREGRPIVQETRGWADDRGVTVSQRVKEGASDYRYFPEPDLPPLVIEDAWIEEIRRRQPELPQQRKARFVEQFGLTNQDVDLLIASKPTADYFEEVVRATNEKREGDVAKAACNWVLGELTRLLNINGMDIEQSNVGPGELAEVLKLIDDGTLSTLMAKNVFEEMFQTGKTSKEVIDASEMVQISDDAAVGAAVAEAIAANPQPVNDYLNGKEAAMKFLVGQVMKITKGKANPQITSKLVKDKLESLR